MSDKVRIYLKWPKIPTTAIVIPAKYVYVSPTKTAEGYLERKAQETVSKPSYKNEGFKWHDIDKVLNTSYKKVNPKR